MWRSWIVTFDARIRTLHTNWTYQLYTIRRPLLRETEHLSETFFQTVAIWIGCRIPTTFLDSLGRFLGSSFHSDYVLQSSTDRSCSIMTSRWREFKMVRWGVKLLFWILRCFSKRRGPPIPHSLLTFFHARDMIVFKGVNINGGIESKGQVHRAVENMGVSLLHKQKITFQFFKMLLQVALP